MSIKADLPSTSLVEQLARTDWRQWFDKMRVEDGGHDWQWVIDHWVARNSYRAFHHKPKPPSQVFRTWAYDALFGRGGGFEGLLTLRTRTEYDNWLDSQVESLRQCWATQMDGEEMSFGPRRKFPNLIMKGICANPRLEQTDFERLVWWLHVPLDSFSMLWIKDYVAASPLATCVGPIRKDVAMGFVKNDAMYQALQQCIRQLADRAGVPPITVDIAAWDGAHNSA